jgi:hypothetical protein
MIWRSVTLISCGIVGGWLGSMASDRHPPVKFYSNEIVNSPHPGEPLRVRSVVWRDRACHTTVHRLIFDKDDRFVIPDVVFAAGTLPLGDDSFIVPIPISPVADPGPAIYRTVHAYRCNPLHWIWPITVGPIDHQFTIAAP